MTLQTNIPVHEVVYRKLRDLILFGEIAPGQAVTIQGLVERLDAGMTPVREAIRRLTSEGALNFQGNRRIIVPVLSDKNMTELYFLRQTLEPRLIFLAAERAGKEDIARLTRIDSDLDRAIKTGDINQYLRKNYQFHSELYRLADAPILEAVADSLWLRYGPSLRVVCGRVGTLGLTDQHKETLAAMTAGNPQKAAEAILADVTQGIDQIKSSIMGK
ncbi:MAG: GntR family transcriptional regulator [Paracoccaceae bacterium]|jgi:DNA-binding GntR family transcriptional regulator